MRENNCIFCKIANGEISSRTLYEDDKFRVILDLGPATKGHALILPKDHYSDLFELPEECAGDVMKLARKMVLKMKEKLGCEGFRTDGISFSYASDSPLPGRWTENWLETAGSVG